MKTTVMVVAGTRPEVIKLAPVIQQLRERGGCDVLICATGQHREMLAQALDVFGLRADLDLDVMRENQTLAELTSNLLTALDGAFANAMPTLVVVQGDTTTAMSGALAAFYRRIPVAHVEAGLRTASRYSPFPEEINRRIIASVAELHFTPTRAARENLLREGVESSAITVSGNTAVDALLATVNRQSGAPLEVRTLAGQLLQAELDSGRLVLVTAHRRESHEEGIASICAAIRNVAQLPDAKIILPVHMNPNVRRVVLPLLDDIPNVFLTDPLDYVTFCRVMQRSWLIMTDSGGIQEEAPSLGVPVLVLRETTERHEGIEAGNAILTGAGCERIVSVVRELWDNPTARQRMASAPNPYGDGKAGERIAESILRFTATLAS